MATTGSLVSTLTFTGDYTDVLSVSGNVNNTASPAFVQFINLASGANTLTAPTAAVPQVLIIIKPSTNTQTLTLKGISGDTGIPLHPTVTDYISLASSVVTLVLTAGGIVNGVRLIWI